MAHIQNGERLAKLNTTERRFLERLAASLEDEQQVDKAYEPPTGPTKTYQIGYRDGARMQAKATAMAIRGLIGHEAQTDKVDATRIKRRGLR